jgi:glycosyltransferase involved in cell wall biosynthesis
MYDGGLVLVGGPYQGRGDPALEEYLCSIEGGHIIRTGPVPDQDLPALYTEAACFVFPSLHEGFGLVPLEAMACGTPVIVSRVGALEQTVADAGLFIDDPTDAGALADIIRGLLADERKQEQMRTRGLARAGALSREKAASRTLTLYENLATEKTGVG